MVGNKGWSIKLDKSVRMFIRFADNNIDTSDGIVNILMKRKDRQEEIIGDFGTYSSNGK